MGKDDGPYASSDQNLEIVRKAAALDRTDPGLLPNM